MASRRALFRTFVILSSALVTFVLPSLGFAKTEWLPIDPADLAAKESKRVPGSDTEILLSKHVMDAEGTETWLQNEIHAKVYTAKGVEQSSIFKIEYEKTTRVRNIAARVLKQNGAIVDVAAKDIHEASAIKWAGAEWKITSFAFPDLAPGDIVEYRWYQATSSGSFSYFAINCQAPAPVREFLFETKNSAQDYQVIWFNCTKAESKKLGRSQMTLRVTNLAPFVEEKLMPPERDFRAWMLVAFSHRWARFYTNDEVWQEIGSYLGEEFRLATDPSGSVKKKAVQIIAGETSPEEKLTKLYDFCQTEISNFDWITSDKLMEAKKKREDESEVQTPEKTLSRGTGSSSDINQLFAGLARAAGFDARLALSASRENLLNIRTPKGWLFLERNSVAVKVGEQWRFYSPGEYCVPAGMLSPKDEFVTTFICDEKKSWYETTPVSQPNQSLVQRKGRFILESDGTLSGDVEIQMTGHAALARKEQGWGKDESEITRTYQEDLSRRLPGIEVTEVHWENLKNRNLPLTLTYKIRVPGYAEVAGSRIIVQPEFFEAGNSALFTEETRTYPIFFDYARRELDDIEMVVPENMTLDSPSVPQNVGEDGAVITARYGIRYKPKSHTLVFQREYMVGNRSIGILPESYPKVKQVFTDIARSDTHSFVLKPKPAVALGGSVEKAGASPSK